MDYRQEELRREDQALESCQQPMRPPAALYHNPSSSMSTQSLAPNARLRGHQGPINPAIHSISQQHHSISQPQPLTPGPGPRQTQEPFHCFLVLPSLSARRAGAPSLPTNPYTSTPAAPPSIPYQGPQNPDLYHPSVMRVLRFCSAQSRPALGELISRH
jgi:hypothetical protein